jgi:thymidylate synthase
MEWKNNFKNANEAFLYFNQLIREEGVEFGDTKAMFNVGFYIENPLHRDIPATVRKWSYDYALAEWEWYLSGDPKISKLGELHGKVPEIWKRMADTSGRVNSNYGYQWQRNDQLDYVINLLKNNPDTRQATISIYDGKEHDKYSTDTPCTYAIQFTILHGKLDMCVTMRSNDLWYGFCNDQFQFSKLQEMISKELKIPMGIYYHFAHNLHLYNNKL